MHITKYCHHQKIPYPQIYTTEIKLLRKELALTIYNIRNYKCHDGGTDPYGYGVVIGRYRATYNILLELTEIVNSGEGLCMQYSKI